MNKLLAIQREAATIKRKSKRFGRWELYETLKSDMPVSDKDIQAIEIMPVVELREGIIEYLLAQRHTNR